MYVLTDNVFRPFTRMSTEAGGQAVVRAQPVRLSTLDPLFDPHDGETLLTSGSSSYGFLAELSEEP